MAKIADATFNGQKRSYSFEVYSTDTTFKAVGAVYIFTKRVVNDTGKGSHTLLYIGQTESLADRIPNHDKWPCVRRHGANCICVHRDENEKSRSLAAPESLRMRMIKNKASTGGVGYLINGT